MFSFTECSISLNHKSVTSCRYLSLFKHLFQLSWFRCFCLYTHTVFTTFSGTTRCGSHWCNTCPFAVEMSQVYFPKSTLSFQKDFTCLSHNFVPAIMCKRCDMEYKGKTGVSLGDRFPQHLDDISKMALTPCEKQFRQGDRRKKLHFCHCNPLLFFRRNRWRCMVKLYKKINVGRNKNAENKMYLLSTLLLP